MASTGELLKFENSGPDDPRYVVRFRLPAGNNQERIVRMERRFPLACLAGAVAYLSETADVLNIDDFIHVFVDESGNHNTVKSAKFWAVFGHIIFQPRDEMRSIIEWPENFTLAEVFDAFCLLGPFDLSEKLVQVLDMSLVANKRNAFIAMVQEFAVGEAISRGIESIAVVGHWLYRKHSRGSSEDAKGLALLMKAAEAGHPFAMGKYGFILYYGCIGVQKDEKRGLESLKKAAANNNLDAIYVMGKRAQSHTEKANWFMRAADAGSTLSAWYCYYIFRNGYYEQEQNKQKAWHYLLLAAYGGDYHAMREVVNELRAEGHTEAVAEWNKMFEA